MSSRKGRATISARSRPTARCATSPTRRSLQIVKLQAGQLVQRQAGRGRGHRPQRGRRQPRLRLRRHQPGLQPRCRKAADERHASRSARRRASMSSGSTSPATPPPATRSSAANSASTKAMRSTRSRSSAARTASRASASSRTSSRSSRPRARRPTASCSASNVEEKPTGQLSLSGGYSSLERFVVQLAVTQNNFMGKGQELDASVNWSRYSKSVEAGLRRPLFPRQADPARRPAVPPRLQQLQLTSATTATRPIRRSAPAAGCGWASRSPNIGASAAATAGQGQDLARQEHLLHRS